MENQFNLIPHDYVVDKEGNVFPKGSGFGGKYTSLPKGYRSKLSKALPAEAIKQHPTKKFLSTIKAIFIAERLNEVFGVNGWNIEHEVVDMTADNKSVPYVVMKGRIYIREYDLYTPYQYGGHQLGGTGTEPADGYKSAVTDLQSKCASLLEIGIQVFKGKPHSKEANVSNIDDEDGAENMKKKVEPAAPKKPAPKKPAPKKEETKKVEPAPVEVEELQTLEDKLSDIASYVDANQLKNDAQEIVFNAKMDGLTSDEEAELKAAINDKYVELTTGK